MTTLATPESLERLMRETLMWSLKPHFWAVYPEGNRLRRGDGRHFGCGRPLGAGPGTSRREFGPLPITLEVAGSFPDGRPGRCFRTYREREGFGDVLPSDYGDIIEEFGILDEEVDHLLRVVNAP